MSRGKTNKDFVFPHLGNAKLAQKLADIRWEKKNGTNPPFSVVESVKFISEEDLELTEGPGPLFAVISEDGEYMVNCRTIEWENVA